MLVSSKTSTLWKPNKIYQLRDQTVWVSCLPVPCSFYQEGLVHALFLLSKPVQGCQVSYVIYMWKPPHCQRPNKIFGFRKLRLSCVLYGFKNCDPISALNDWSLGQNNFVIYSIIIYYSAHCKYLLNIIYNIAIILWEREKGEFVYSPLLSSQQSYQFGVKNRVV